MKDGQDTMPLLEIFVALVSYRTNRSQRCQKSSGCLHKREETLRTSPLLTMYYFSTPREFPTKMDIVWDDQDPSQMHAWKSPCSTSPWASVIYQELVQKSNEVLKDIENVPRRECLVPRVASFVKNARLRVLRSMLLQEGPSLLT